MNTKATGRTRATQTNEKNQRISAILGSAAALLAQKPYNKITVDEIAKGADIAKGSVYVYFPTKEAVYLTVLKEQFTGWFLYINTFLHSATGRGAGINEFVNFVTNSLTERPLFLKLATILHSILEENTPEPDILAFKQFLLREIHNTGTLLENGTVFTPKGEGARLLINIYILLLGVQLLASPSGAVLSILEKEPQLASLRFSFEREFSRALQLHIKGISARS